MAAVGAPQASGTTQYSGSETPFADTDSPPAPSPHPSPPAVWLESSPRNPPGTDASAAPAYVSAPSGTVVLAEEVLDAARAVEKELVERSQREDAGQLVAACVVEGASLPSYRLTFRGWKDAVCVYRPWRVYDWYFNLDTHPGEDPPCACETPP